MHGPLSAILLAAARRSDDTVMDVAGQEYALGMSAASIGKVVVAALPMPQGLSQTTTRIRAGAAAYWQLFRARNGIRTIFFLMLLLITVFVFFSSVWLAMFLSKQITRPVEALGDGDGRDCRRQVRPSRGLIATGEMGDLVRVVQPHGGGSGGEPAVGGELVSATDRGQPGDRGTAARTGDHRGDDSQRRGDAGRGGRRCCRPIAPLRR